MKDTSHFLINFIENTSLPEKAVEVMLDVSSLYTTFPQEEGIGVVYQYTKSITSLSHLSQHHTWQMS